MKPKRNPQRGKMILEFRKNYPPNFHDSHLIEFISFSYYCHVLGIENVIELPERKELNYICNSYTVNNFCHHFKRGLVIESERIYENIEDIKIKEKVIEQFILSKEINHTPYSFSYNDIKNGQYKRTSVFKKYLDLKNKQLEKSHTKLID